MSACRGVVAVLAVLSVLCAGASGTYGNVWSADHRQPVDVMVDVVNRLGLVILKVHNFNNENNIALSPYGAASILTALLEGVRGNTAAASEIQQCGGFPLNKDVIRVGLRDIHRLLRSYFIPQEGFLSGLSLSSEKVTLNPEYQSILRFYGFDMTSFNTPIYPNIATTTVKNNLTTTDIMTTQTITPKMTTIQTNGKVETTTLETTTLQTTTVPMTTMQTTTVPTTVQTTTIQTTTIPTTTIQTTLPTTTTTTTTIPTTTTVATTTTVPTTVETTTFQVENRAMATEPDETTTVEPTTETTTTKRETTTIGTTTTTEVTTTEITTTEATTTTKPDTTTTETDTTTTEVPTTQMTEAVTTEKEKDTTTVETTTEETTTEKPTKERKRRSIVDYFIARYYDDHDIASFSYSPHIPHHEPPKDINYPFLVNGKFLETGINFMTYDVVLPFYYIRNLNSLALKFPLDSPKYYLLLILPVDTFGINKLICDIDKTITLKQIVTQMTPTFVRAVIPSFMLRGFVILTPTLEKIGIKRIFQPRQADFTPMTEDKDIYVTNIEQAITVTIKNYMDPKMMTRNGQSYQYGPVDFKATHPFLYFVMDTKLDVALVAGKIVNPLNSRIQ